jgi:hypothetical protein
MRINWNAVLSAAHDIVDEYDTLVTLRQLHYRLVSMPELGYSNTLIAYKSLSRATARARRDDGFPALHDRNRSISRLPSWTSPQSALRALRHQYRRDRTEGQVFAIYLAVEKAGLVTLMQSWFEDMGLPILALSGYASQSYTDDVADDVRRDGRPAVLLYAGDHDPSGEDIDRDFTDRTDCWKEIRRIALSAEQVEEYNLPPAFGKTSDSRAAAFVARHGHLVQVELDALPPDTLHDLFDEALSEFWDVSALGDVLEQERIDTAWLDAR